MGSKNHWLAAAVLAVVGPFAGAAPVRADGTLCKLQISGNDLMQYDKKDLTASPACSQIEVTLKHVGKLPASAMGHNWVLVKSSDLSAVANAGAAAGFGNNYLEPGDPRVIAATRIVGGGQSATVRFAASKLVKGDSYMYLCTFPGHNALMRGTFHYD